MIVGHFVPCLQHASAFIKQYTMLAGVCRFVRSAYQIYQLPAAHKNNLSYWEPYRFVDDNTLPVVLPAILDFVEMVLQHATAEFGTNQRVSQRYADNHIEEAQIQRHLLFCIVFICQMLSFCGAAAHPGAADCICHCHHELSDLADDAACQTSC